MAVQQDKASGGETAAEAEEIDAATARTQRVLLITVIILGILLIIGFAVVVATIASRISSSGDDVGAAPLAAGPAAVAVTAAGDFELPVPAGYAIQAVTGDERRLMIHLRGAAGMPERIMVVNTRDGQVMRSLVLTPSVP